MTKLHVRRRRTRAVHRSGGCRYHADLADSRAHHGNESAARVVGTVHVGAPVWGVE